MTLLLAGLVRLVFALGTAGLFGWAASALIGEPGQQRHYSNPIPAPEGLILSVAVAPPGDADPANPILTVPIAELESFLKSKPRYQTRLVAGQTCWPDPPSPEGTKTCVTASAPENDAQRIEVHQSFGGDRDSRSVYVASSAGITPVSYTTVHGVEVLGAALGVGVAGLIGLLVGLRLGKRAANGVRAMANKNA
jgi:hypothetical protein